MVDNIAGEEEPMVEIEIEELVTMPDTDKCYNQSQAHIKSSSNIGLSLLRQDITQRIGAFDTP